LANLTISPHAEQASITDAAFAEAYYQLRHKEGRIVGDDQLLQLPKVKRWHPHYKEWKIRAISALRLIQYLKQQPGVLDILEVGCGNGWLAAQLAANPMWQVTATDINQTELLQAQRVFGHLPNLQFVHDHLGEDSLTNKTFDIIVFAASVQYFPSLKETIGEALTHSSIRGEVHILDTAFYQPTELVAARQRSIDYYTQLGFPQMAQCYFHHSLQELEGFQYKLLHRPGRIWQGLGFVHHPFCHIQIKNHCL
jgi:ubiquinone/menaquinone biosynthesis C-methylase UbiE